MRGQDYGPFSAQSMHCCWLEHSHKWSNTSLTHSLLTRVSMKNVSRMQCVRFRDDASTHLCCARIIIFQLSLKIRIIVASKLPTSIYIVVVFHHFNMIIPSALHLNWIALQTGRRRASPSDPLFLGVIFPQIHLTMCQVNVQSQQFHKREKKFRNINK